MTNTSLAINGGTPVRTKPWKESNALGKEEQDAAMRVLQSGHLSLFQGAFNPHPPYNFRGGPEVQALEELASSVLQSKHVVAINSATSGLSAAVGALQIGPGDEVIVSPYTMSACAVAPLWYGAIPVFADVNAYGCLDPASVKANVTPRTKAIIVVHQFGIPADMDGIMAIAEQYNLQVIEDCAQAWGASYKGQTVGTIGDIGVCSFNVHKTIQSGEGGLCITQNDDLAFRLQLIRNHGEAVVGDANYRDIENIVGGNFRLTELQAAICQEQLKKLPVLNAKRIAMVHKLYDALKRYDFLEVRLPK
jgi:dTDP-4-amino-4,6-dideoxygalactose transaminase